MQPTQNNYQLDNFRFPGYGWFWVANSISSTLLGVVTRERQKEMLSQSQEFQLEINGKVENLEYNIDISTLIIEDYDA